MEFYDFSDDYLERLCAGDAATVQHFVAYFGKLLRIKLRTEVPSREDAEDLSQTTFLRFFVALHRDGQIRDGKRLGAYVFGICQRVVWEWRRKPKHDQLPVDDDINKIRSRDPSAYDFLESEEMTHIVRAILDELPEKDRRILRAIYFDERDKDEVCAEYGITRANLRVVTSRARKKFREKYPNDPRNKPGDHPGDHPGEDPK